MAGMAGLITQYDATAPDLLPAIDQAALDVAVASYCDLRYAAGWIGCVHKFPALSQIQRVLSIAGSTSSIARILDYEPGNPCYGNPAGAVAWLEAMIHHGVYLPGLYADRNDMPELQAEVVKSPLPRDHFALWLAAPGVDPLVLLAAGFDAVQTRFLRSFDVSLCKPHFFPPLPPPPKPQLTQGVLKFAGELDTETGAWQIHGQPNHGISWGTRPVEWTALITVGNEGGDWHAEPRPFQPGAAIASSQKQLP